MVRVLMIVCVFCCGALCAGAQRAMERLVSEELLRAGNLEIVWENKLPMTKGESLRELHIRQGRLYGLSDRNYLTSLDRRTGEVQFVKAVAPQGFPLLGLELYRNELLSVIGGNELVNIDVESGTQTGSHMLDFVARCAAVRNESCYYIAGSDRRLHALSADEKLELFEVSADNDSMMTSVVADEQLVVFGTEAGNIVAITPDGPGRLWQFDATGAIAEQLVRDGNSLFAASNDTNIYRLDLLSGTLVWKYQTGAILTRSPRVGRDVVYQPVDGRGVAAIERAGGRLIWQLPKGRELLAEANGRAYLITDVGTLAVMDNKKGQELYSMNLSGISRYVVNTSDSMIYIGAPDGRVACLRPVEAGLGEL